MTVEIRPEELLTKSELALIDCIGGLMSGFLEVVGDGPTRSADLCEIVSLIHALQDKVMGQAAARAYPDRLRLLGAVVR